jgi:hypothetical protein
MQPRILLAALLTLLTDALDQAETRHLTNDGLDAELRALRTRVEAELSDLAGERRLRLVDDPPGSVSAD